MYISPDWPLLLNLIRGQTGLVCIRAHIETDRLTDRQTDRHTDTPTCTGKHQAQVQMGYASCFVNQL